MAIQTSAGTQFGINSLLPTPYTYAIFDGLTGWVDVAEITDIGEFGKEYNLVTHMPVAGRQVKKLKGSYNNGTVQLQMARDANALSKQVNLRNARDSDASFSFRVTLQDAAKLYFTGKVMSYKTQVGGVDSVTGATCAIELDGDVMEI